MAAQTGLLLSLDGLAPEGGEPQLWVVRELQTGLTVRSGWLSQQDHMTFSNFLQPIADQGWRVTAILSDKQCGLTPAAAVEQLKVTLRQDIRDRVGSLIRNEAGPDAPGVLTVTGLLPSPLAPTPMPAAPAATPAQNRESIVQDLLRRARYLLTLKARPLFGLAGLEMYERLAEVVTCLGRLLDHQPEPRLAQLRSGLQQALATPQADYVRATWGYGQMALFLDGILRDSRSFVVTPDALAPRLYVGSSSSGNMQAHAMLDELVIRSTTISTRQR